MPWFTFTAIEKSFASLFPAEEVEEATAEKPSEQVFEPTAFYLFAT
jgi:hypothetical protein